MKQLFNIILCLIAVSCIQDVYTTSDRNMSDKHETVNTQTKSLSSTYYWYNDEKIYLDTVEGVFFAIFRFDTESENTLLASSHNIEFQIKQFSHQQLNGNDKATYITAKISSEIADTHANEIVYCAPYLRAPSGEIGITDKFYVKLKSESDRPILEHFVKEHGITSIERSLIPLWYELTCNGFTNGNALELANMAYESGLFDKTDIGFADDIQWSETNFYNDTYYISHQWNLHGAFGIDIERAHLITSGNATTKIAIIDSGFQLNHPELNIDNSWDAVSRTSPAKLYYESNGAPHSHGTSMVGIIGATTNNNMGIAGIAPDVSLLPISLGVEIDPETVSSAIYYAAQQDADIISNSYTLTASHSIVDEACLFALGKECVIVQSIGNANNSTPQYPYASQPEIITVGNITQNGLRNSSSSKYGTHLDIVAPGTQITTLYPDDRYTYVTGTSPACPHVAATAALIRSINPDLTRQEVSDILESTARKLPAYTFTTTSGRPNGTWNNEVGYGLVNCYDAVNLAYHYNANNYFNLIEFDYSGSQIEIDLKTKDNIAVIWDWETKDISYINATASSPIDTTITHNYGTTGSRRVIIAETIAPGETAPTSSTSLTRFELTTGNNASNIDIKSINSALEYIRIIGGATMNSQEISIEDLSSLKDLYLIHMPDVAVHIDNCPLLKRFGSSRYIWGAPLISNPLPLIPSSNGNEESLYPNIVGGGSSTPAWPTIPETVISFRTLNITNCQQIEEVSLENVNISQFNFIEFPNLQYLYVSSHNGRIVGGGTHILSPMYKGQFLAQTISTLPQRSPLFKGKILIRGVSTDNSDYVKAIIAPSYQTQIESTALEKNWNLVWDSGVTDKPSL